MMLYVLLGITLLAIVIMAIVIARLHSKIQFERQKYLDAHGVGYDKGLAEGKMQGYERSQREMREFLDRAKPSSGEIQGDTGEVQSWDMVNKER